MICTVRYHQPGIQDKLMQQQESTIGMNSLQYWKQIFLSSVETVSPHKTTVAMGE